MMLFVPLVTYGLYPWLERRGIRFTPLRRIGTGLVLTATSFLGVALIQRALEMRSAALGPLAGGALRGAHRLGDPGLHHRPRVRLHPGTAPDEGHHHEPVAAHHLRRELRGGAGQEARARPRDDRVPLLGRAHLPRRALLRAHRTALRGEATTTCRTSHPPRPPHRCRERPPGSPDAQKLTPSVATKNSSMPPGWNQYAVRSSFQKRHAQETGRTPPRARCGRRGCAGPPARREATPTGGRRAPTRRRRIRRCRSGRRSPTPACELKESGPQASASSSPRMGPPTSPNMQPTMGVSPTVTVCAELEVPADERRRRPQRLVVVAGLEMERTMVRRGGAHSEVGPVVHEVPGERGSEAPGPLLPRRVLHRVLHRLRTHRDRRHESDRDQERGRPTHPHPPSAVTSATSTTPIPSIESPTLTGETPE